MLSDLEAYRANNEKSETTFKPIQEAPQKAREMLKQALELSRSNRLNEAANLLEKAMNYFPPYREEYQGFLAALREDRNQ
jgi:hypothetical protein